MKNLKQLPVALAFLVMCLTVPQLASAKWSKASTKFSYGGVEVEVIDRHKDVGKPFDTYGYTIFENRNDEIVNLEWRGYGILKHTHKLVLLSLGDFVLQPKEVRKEVYSYGGGRFTRRDFEKYVVAIKPIKEKPKTEPETVPTANASKNDKAEQENMDKIYERLMKHKKAGELTENDYNDAAKWIGYVWAKNIRPLMQQVLALHQHDKDDEIKKINLENEALLKQWNEVGAIVREGYSDDKLSPESTEIFENMKEEYNLYAH